MRGALHRSECINKEQGLGALLGELLDALLQFRDLLGIAVGQIGLFRRVLWDVVQLDGGRKRGPPDQLPVAYAHAAAKWLDVVDDLLARRGTAARLWSTRHQVRQAAFPW